MTQDEVLALLDYDPNTGTFLWKKTGKVAGGIKDGYWVVRINRRNYYGHRLAWLIVKGELPAGDIDHEDLNRANNQFFNLREATPSQNGSNSAVRRHNKIGLKGVRREKKGRFQAQITVNGKCRRIGRYDTAEEAHAAYVRTAKIMFGEFARAA